MCKFYLTDLFDELELSFGYTRSFLLHSSGCFVCSIQSEIPSMNEQTKDNNKRLNKTKHDFEHFYHAINEQCSAIVSTLYLLLQYSLLKCMIIAHPFQSSHSINMKRAIYCGSHGRNKFSDCSVRFDSSSHSKNSFKLFIFFLSYKKRRMKCIRDIKKATLNDTMSSNYINVGYTRIGQRTWIFLSNAKPVLFKCNWKGYFYFI